MDLDSFVFVDIETTGISRNQDSIIEIAALKVEGGKLIRSYRTLINPHITLPPFIQDLTGISASDLDSAPDFSGIKDELFELLSGSIFVAHNARFDYSFIRKAFENHEISFTAKQLCTVKLFRALNPGLRRYNLDSLIETYKLPVKHRHRAWDDAKALFDFYKKAKRMHPKETFEAAIHKILKHISTPINLTSDDLESLPESPGVYIFWSDDNDVPLYVGKSINIKDRVLSHFADSPNSAKELNISQQVKRVEAVATAGELTALLAESTYIKKLQPLYNRQLRLRQRLIIARVSQNSDGYKTVKLEAADSIAPDDLESIVGIYRSVKQAQETLQVIAKDHKLCPKLVGTHKSKSSCFWYQLGWCKGACVKNEPPLFYNTRFIEAFSKYQFKRWPFVGPVVIREGSRNLSSAIIVDKWCILKSGTWDDSGSLSTEDLPYSFDLDAYKILFRFLSKDQNLKKVHVL